MRARLELILDRMNWQWVLPTARSDEYWRRGRKILDRGLRPGAAASHRPMLQTRARVLLSRLLTNPQQWEDYIDLSVERAPHRLPLESPELSGKYLGFREKRSFP
jgi:cytochrome P450